MSLSLSRRRRERDPRAEGVALPWRIALLALGLAALAGGPLAADTYTCDNLTINGASKCVMAHGTDSTSCMADAGRPAAGCTANDLTFVVTDLGVQDDGCYGTGDTAKIRLRNQIANTTSQTRYDLGFWYATDGDASAFGAANGQCDRAVVFDTRIHTAPANACSPTAAEGLLGVEFCGLGVPGGTCTNDDPDRLDIYGTPGNGPYDNAETGPSEVADFCRDIRTNSVAGCDSSDADSLRDGSLYDLPFPITIPCSTLSGGFLQIAACLSWGNNANQIGGSNNACDDATELSHGTASKCTCQVITTKVSVPSLALECKISAGFNPPTSTSLSDVQWVDSLTVRSGPSGGGNPPSMQVLVKLTYTNSASCDWSTTNNVRQRCGTSSMARFDATDSVSGGGAAGGSYTTTNTTLITDSDGIGRVSFQNTDESIRWYPNTDATYTDHQESVIPPQTDTVSPPGGTLNGYTDTFYYWYTVPTGLADASTVTLNHTMVWFDKRCSIDTLQMCSSDSDCPSGSGTCTNLESTTAVNQLLTDACTLNISTTYAQVGGVAARKSGGTTLLEWQTTAEVGTAGFLVERLDGASGKYVPVGKIVPALDQLSGGRYRVADPTAPRRGKVTYRLTEVDKRGLQRVLGTYPLAVGDARPRWAPASRGIGFAAEPKDVSPRLAAAAVERRAAAAAKAGSAPGAVTGTTAASRSRARVGVVGPGFARVPLRELAIALGAPRAEAAALVNGGQLRVTRGGEEVAWQAAPDGDGLLLWALGLETPYTDTDVYFVERGGGTAIGAVQAQASTGGGPPSFRRTLHLETDAIPAVTSQLPLDDFWIWKSFFPGFPGFDRFTFGGIVDAPAARSATLEVLVQGFAAVQRADVRLNGSWLGELSWEGAGRRTLSLDVPAGRLRDGFNEIEVFAREAERGFWVDSFDLTYDRLYRAAGNRLDFTAGSGDGVELSGFGAQDIAVYDVGEPLLPRRLEGALPRLLGDGTWGVSFQAPGAGPFTAVALSSVRRAASVQASAPADLRHPARGGAEYLVITPLDLRNQAQRLVDLRAGQGLSALRVDLDDVMDLFSDGVYDPLAIQRFLAYAAGSWSQPPRYVALAGKGTYDPKNHLGLYSNLLPTPLVAVKDGIAPADGLLGDLDGDGVPELAIGRIPATTVSDMRAYVDKLIAYEGAADAPWMDRGLLIADDNDFGGDFTTTGNLVISGASPTLGVSRLTLPASASASELEAARTSLFGAFRQGQLLMSYVGHGGLDRITSEGLLLTSDVAKLGNGSRQPVLVALTCLISQFAYPWVSSLGEELVLQGDGGTAAVFGPTWLSTNSLAGNLGGALMPRLSAAGGGRLGDRLLAGLDAYAAAGGDAETLNVYTLLGDPALALRRN